MAKTPPHSDLKQLIVRYLGRDGWSAADLERLQGDGSGGACPDILLERNGEWLAVCIGSLPDVLDRRSADRWEELLGIDRMSLMVAVLDRKALNAARATAAARGLDVDIRYFEKKRRRAESEESDLFERHPGLDWSTIAIAALILFMFLLLMSPIVRNMLHINDFYRPFDRERQNWELQEQE